jgi:hypothetical protein
MERVEDHCPHPYVLSHAGRGQESGIDSETPVCTIDVGDESHGGHVHRVAFPQWGRVVALAHAPAGILVTEHRPCAYRTSICRLGMNAHPSNPNAGRSAPHTQARRGDTHPFPNTWFLSLAQYHPPPRGAEQRTLQPVHPPRMFELPAAGAVPAPIQSAPPPTAWLTPGSR